MRVLNVRLFIYQKFRDYHVPRNEKAKGKGEGD